MFQTMAFWIRYLTLLTIVALSFSACSKNAEKASKPAETAAATTASSSSSTETAEDASNGDIQYIKWTPNLNIPDPVAISMDNKGRAYVTQTVRRKAQDLDIRNNRDWVPDDVGLDSVEDKREFFKAQLSSERSVENVGRVLDHIGMFGQTQVVVGTEI